MGKFPDYRLVPRDEEHAFCRWDQVQDYDPEKLAPLRSRYMEMPPLQRLAMERSRRARGDSVEDKDFLLPAYNTYEHEARFSEEVEPNLLSEYLEEEFATHKNFDMDLIPKEKWHLDRIGSQVGHRIWPDYTEGRKTRKSKTMGVEALWQREKRLKE